MSRGLPLHARLGRRRALTVVSLTAALIAGGCAQIFGIDGPTEVTAPGGDAAVEARDATPQADTAAGGDGTVGEASLDAPADAGPADAGGESSLDAASDTTKPVEAGGGDAGTDAPDASDAHDASDSSRFCDTVDAAFYCEDFDLTSSVASIFSPVYLTDSGVIVIDGTDPRSPPHSLRMSVSGGANNEVALANHDLGVIPPTGVTLEFDAKVSPASGQGEGPAGLVFSSGADQQVISIQTDPTDVGVFDYFLPPDGGASAFAFKNAPYTLDPAKWTHFTLDVSQSGVGYQASVSVDGNLLVTLPLRPAFVFEDAYFNPGVNNAPGETGEYAITVDNVVVRVR